MATDQALKHFAAHRGAYLDDLKKLVRIPSVSFPGFDPAKVRASAEATSPFTSCSLLISVPMSISSEPAKSCTVISPEILALSAERISALARRTKPASAWSLRLKSLR